MGFTGVTGLIQLVGGEELYGVTSSESIFHEDYRLPVPLL